MAATTGSGLDSIFAHAAESTYGTYQTPASALLFTEESLSLEVPRMEAAGIGDGQLVQRSDQWTTGRRTVSGDISTEMTNLGLVGIFGDMLGDAGKVADGTGWHHTFKVGGLAGTSRTFQFDKPDTNIGLNSFAYVGCKIVGWEIAQSGDGYAVLTLTIDAQDEDTAQAAIAVSPPAAFELFSWKTLAVTVDGSPFNVTECSLSGTNPMKTDRYFLAGSDLKAEPLENAKRTFEGSLSGEFESMDAYNRFVNADPGDPASMVDIVFTWTCVATYETGKPYKLVATYSAARFDGTTPNIGGPDVLSVELPFVGLDNGTDEPFQLELYTDEAT